jgi:hypothetical protein
MIPTLQGKEMCNATPSGSALCNRSIPVAMSPAIEFVDFGDIVLLRSPSRYPAFISKGYHVPGD